MNEHITKIDDTILDLFRRAKKITFLTGAGVSAESGIPTFRDELTGLWKHYDVEKLASEEGFVNDPSLVWGWYEWRRAKVAAAQPNPAHLAIAELEKRFEVTVVTQNVDDLHERAGSTNIRHLHGELNKAHCIQCGDAYTHKEFVFTKDEVELEQARIEPPKCRCGGYYRPSIVWFGESLNTDVWEDSVEACNEAHLLIVIGTSAQVYPAASLPYNASLKNVPVLNINPEENNFRYLVPFFLKGKAGDVMTRIMNQL